MRQLAGRQACGYLLGRSRDVSNSGVFVCFLGSDAEECEDEECDDGDGDLQRMPVKISLDGLPSNPTPRITG